MRNIKNFGTCAAKLDDLVNYIPARLSAWFMVAAAAVEGHHWKDAIRIYRRDRRNHASPNSAQTEAVMAGRLECSLREMHGILENYMKSRQSEMTNER